MSTDHDDDDDVLEGFPDDDVFQGLLGQTSHQVGEQIRLLMKCKFLIEKDSGEKEMAMQVMMLLMMMMMMMMLMMMMIVAMKVDEVAKGLKITSLSAKKSGIKTNSVHQSR